MSADKEPPVLWITARIAVSDELMNDPIVLEMKRQAAEAPALLAEALRRRDTGDTT